MQICESNPLYFQNLKLPNNSVRLRKVVSIMLIKKQRVFKEHEKLVDRKSYFKNYKIQLPSSHYWPEHARFRIYKYTELSLSNEKICDILFDN